MTALKWKKWHLYIPKTHNVLECNLSIQLVMNQIKRKKGKGKKEKKQTCVQNLSKTSRLKEYIIGNLIQ